MKKVLLVTFLLVGSLVFQELIGQSSVTQQKEQSTNNTFHVGQSVEAINSGWRIATVWEIVTGDKPGNIKVHYHGYSTATDQYISQVNIRPLKEKSDENYTDGPRNGRYTIRSYGNINNPIILGYFDITKGTYKYYNAGKKLIGSGKYTYDASSKLVTWQGPLKDYNSTAKFEIRREGKTHHIEMKYGTYATNNTD